MNELETIPGTGNEGRVTKRDILEYVAKGRNAGHRLLVTGFPATSHEQPATSNQQPATCIYHLLRQKPK